MARAAAEKTDRRRLILASLYRCISTQGYANTTLKDIADRAEMSPSHVGYYFENKPAILEAYAASICRQNLAALPDPAEPDLARLIDQLADFCLGAGQMTTGLLGVIQELSGLAVHDGVLHDIKSRHTSALREYLEGVFARVESMDGDEASESASLAHAVLVGLNTNTLFDSALERETAHATFRNALRELARLDTHSPNLRPAPKRAARRPKPKRKPRP